MKAMLPAGISGGHGLPRRETHATRRDRVLPQEVAEWMTEGNCTDGAAACISRRIAAGPARQIYSLEEAAAD